MAEFMTFRRWVITDIDKEAEVVALVRDAIVPAYRQLPGCLKLGLLRIAGTNAYLATQHWESRAAYEAAMRRRRMLNGGRPMSRLSPIGTR